MGKIGFKLGGMALAVFWAAGLCAAALAQAGNPAAEKAASVNGAVITVKELERELRQLQQRMAGQGKRLNDAELGAMKKDLLESLIHRELIHQESRRQKITAQESQVAAQYDELKKRFAGEAEFQQWLQQMNITEAEIKKQIRQDLELKAFIDRNYAGNIAVTEAEVRSYYESHPDFFRQPEKIRASHILIKVDPQADAAQKSEAHRQLQAIQQKLDSGEDFGALAIAFSQGPSSSKSGDLGYFGRGQMVKPFEEAAFALKPGEVSAIVETEFGFHLIKVFDKKPETIAEFNEVKAKIEQYLKQDKIRKQVGDLIEKLKGQADVQRYI